MFPVFRRTVLAAACGALGLALTPAWAAYQYKAYVSGMLATSGPSGATQSATMTFASIPAQTGSAESPFTLDLAPFLSVTGDPAYTLNQVTWGLQGILPTGLILSGSVLSGTPLAETSGAVSVTVTANYKGNSAQTPITLTISPSGPRAVLTTQGNLLAFALDSAGNIITLEGPAGTGTPTVNKYTVQGTLLKSATFAECNTQYAQPESSWGPRTIVPFGNNNLAFTCNGSYMYNGSYNYSATLIFLDADLNKVTTWTTAYPAGVVPQTPYQATLRISGRGAWSWSGTGRAGNQGGTISYHKGIDGELALSGTSVTTSNMSYLGEGSGTRVVDLNWAGNLITGTDNTNPWWAACRPFASPVTNSYKYFCNGSAWGGWTPSSTQIAYVQGSPSTSYTLPSVDGHGERPFVDSTGALWVKGVSSTASANTIYRVGGSW